MFQPPDSVYTLTVKIKEVMMKMVFENKEHRKREKWERIKKSR